MEKLRGAAIVGQSGGPTAAINATLAGVIKGALEEESITKLYGMRNGIDGFMKENTVDLSEIFADAPDKLDMLASTPVPRTTPIFTRSLKRCFANMTSAISSI